jgi:hypothetical protein
LGGNRKTIFGSFNVEFYYTKDFEKIQTGGGAIAGKYLGASGELLGIAGKPFSSQRLPDIPSHSQLLPEKTAFLFDKKTTQRII